MCCEKTIVQSGRSREPLGDVRDDVGGDTFSDVLPTIDAAKNGVGREGLVLRGFAMPLHHLGLPSFVVGDMTAPPLAAGGLLVCSAGPGTFATVAALVEMLR